MTVKELPEIKKIVVVGGGAAGWLAASHLAKKLCSNHPDGIEVHLVESENIPTIGVGEGTVPAMRESIKYLGISETKFIQACDVSFKQSIKFVDWVYNPGTNKANFYHHLFDYPNTYEFDSTPYWVMGELGDRSYANSVSIQGLVCDQNLGPKTMLHPEFEGVTSYAYHLDAVKFGELLADHAVQNLGVQRRFADIVDAKIDAKGNLVEIVGSSGELFEADFFVDCTGFSGFLIGQKLAVPFVDKSDTLFVDKALALQVPYENDNSAIPSFTLSTACDAGWIWDIGLPTRRGTGCVYSSSHSSTETAEQDFRHYLGDAAKDLEIRKIDMKIGHREKFWVGNCASIGLSQGFVEPLEATGLLLFDASSRMLAELLPSRKSALRSAAKQYNSVLSDTWAKVIDFIKLHYLISKRTDSEFWLDNRLSSSVPDSLLENIEKWQHRLPSQYDFTSTNSVFNLENYLYVLYGMDFHSDISNLKYRFSQNKEAQQAVRQNEKLAESVMDQLLPHRELLARINKYGLQRI